jgi:hypothetical protein
MKRAAMLWCAAVCLVWAMVAQAQETMMGPPKVLVIQREMLKPGKAPAHAKWEAGWPRAFSKANWPTHYIAATGLTGQPRALFFVGFDSLAAWEADNAAVEKDKALSAELDTLLEKDGDYLSESRQAVFSYMDELSYHPQVPVAGTRYFRVYTIHVKPGHGQHFEEVRKIARAAHEKAGLQDHYAVFSTIAGAPTGTYLLFVPMKSLSEIDEFGTVHGKAYKDALGEDGQKKLEEFEREAVESMESNILALAPEMSYPRKEWVDADKFWAPSAAAKPAAKKADKKADKK